MTGAGPWSASLAARASVAARRSAASPFRAAVSVSTSAWEGGGQRQGGSAAQSDRIHHRSNEIEGATLFRVIGGG